MRDRGLADMEAERFAAERRPKHRLEVRIGDGPTPTWVPTAYVFDTAEEADEAIERCADLHPHDRFRSMEVKP